MRKIIGLIVFLVLSCPLFVMAQNLPDTIHLPMIEVLPTSVLEQAGLTSFSIDEAIIDLNVTSNLSDILSKYSPIFIKNYGLSGLATASFRGTTASHTKVYWEGIPIHSPMAGQADFSLMPLFFIGKLEIHPGASALVHGSGALGGSVSIASKINKDHSLLGLTQEIGSFGSNKTYVSLHRNNSKNYVSLKLFRESTENDFTFINTASGKFDEQKQQNADLEKYGFLADYTFFLNSNNTFSAHIWGQQSERNLPPIMSYAGVGRKEYQHDKEWRGIFKWNRSTAKWTSILSMGGIYTKHDYHLSNDTPLGLVLNYDSKSEIKTGFLRLESDYKLNYNLLLKTRIENQYDKVDIFDNKSLLGYAADRNTLHLKTSLHHALGAWKYYVLLHQNIVSNYNIPLIWSAGIERTFGKNPWILKFNSTKNYNIPTLNDLHWIPGGNPELKPERGYNFEFNVKKSFRILKDWNLTMASSLFWTEMEDWILWKPGDFRYWTAENVQNVRSRGIELQGHLNKSFNTNNQIYFHFNYSFTKTTDQTEYPFLNDHKGLQLIYVPIQKFSVLARYRFKNWNFSYESEWTDERFTTASNIPTRHRLPSYGLQHVSVGKEIKVKQLEFFTTIKINNIFNTSYQAILWRAMPGRYFNFFVQIKI